MRSKSTWRVSVTVRHRYVLVVLLAISAVYINHFENGFHFDDAHTVVENPAIRSLSNIPRFFTDATTFSVLPANRTYRPLVSASLALDYTLGGGLKPLYFHLTIFLLFLAQIVCMYFLFVALLDAAVPGSDGQHNRLAALLAAAWYGLHPAMAETVNYVIQRGDLLSTLGLVAALTLYVRVKRLRVTGLYLLPLLLGLLAKPPAAVFPVLLFLYVVLFEQSSSEGWKKALLASLPSLALCAGMMALQSAMTPHSYKPSALSAAAYRITQPFVLLRYLGSLFFPLHLNVDTDLQPFASFNVKALAGLAAVVVLVLFAIWCCRRRSLRPVAFGLLWFFVTSLPTSLYSLSEVENDHRMFLPFVGLVLAVVWAAFLLVEKLEEKWKSVLPRRIALVAACLALAIYANGVRLRNQVWRTDEALWRDDVQKCPRNGRGWMNYGLSLMQRGAYPEALAAFQEALVFTPAYPTLEVNLGIVYGQLNDIANAQAHFDRAIALAPSDDQARFFYARWLYQNGYIEKAADQLRTAIQLNPQRISSHELLIQALAASGDLEQAMDSARQALNVDPANNIALAFLKHPAGPDASFWINASLTCYRNRDFDASIHAARQALKIDPRSALAYNNIGASAAALQQWDMAIESETEALRLNPNLEISRNNLALYTRLKGSTAKPSSPEDYLNASLSAYRAGLYRDSIANARAALRLRPNYAEAYNNIASGSAALGQWDDAIAAAEQAIRLKPDFQLAKNNLAWALSQKQAHQR
jgi:tetratricopeptide (TPR) repeat protein